MEGQVQDTENLIVILCGAGGRWGSCYSKSHEDPWSGWSGTHQEPEKELCGKRKSAVENRRGKLQARFMKALWAVSGISPWP